MHGARFGGCGCAGLCHCSQLARERLSVADGEIAIARQRQRQVRRDRARENRHLVDGRLEQRDRMPFARASMAKIKASAVIPFNETEAMAVLIPGDATADLNAAVARANESLAEFQRIRRWTIWPEPDFPRTPGTRKIIKTQLAEVPPQSVVVPSIDIHVWCK